MAYKSFIPVNNGNPILTTTFRVGPSTGILPYRVVCFDPSQTPSNVGDGNLAAVKHPSTTFAAADMTVGVATGQVRIAQTGSDGNDPATAWAAFNANPQNGPVAVLTHGIVPILCDDTTDSTAIGVGTYVRTSTSNTTTISGQTVKMDGTVAAAAKTSNAFNAGQHIVGQSISRVAPAADDARYALVLLRPFEV